jgi:hypothetical protein
VLSLAALLFRLAFVVVGRPVGMLLDRGHDGRPRPARRRLAAATLPALGAFTRAQRGASVALDGDIRYRPKT